MKIKLGQLVQTAGISDLIQRKIISPADVDKIILAHENCDWGTCSDKEMNDLAAKNNDDRCMGVHIVNNQTIWIITEWDRSATTLLIPSEY